MRRGGEGNDDDDDDDEEEEDTTVAMMQCLWRLVGSVARRTVCLADGPAGAQLSLVRTSSSNSSSRSTEPWAVHLCSS